MFPFGRLLELIFSLVVPAIFDPIAYLYLFSQQINIHTYITSGGGASATAAASGQWTLSVSLACES